jgi:hypothetical protein
MQEIRRFAQRLNDILLTTQLMNYDDIKKLLERLQIDVADYLRSQGPGSLEETIAARQLYVITKWMVNNPAFIIDFYFRILFLAISDILKQKAIGKDIPLEVVEDAARIAEQYRDVILWSPFVFQHTRGGVLQLIQGINQVIRRTEMDKEERRLLNRIKRLLEPITQMSASEVPIRVSPAELLFAHVPVKIDRNNAVEFVNLFKKLSERVDTSAPFYRQILSRPLFGGIERPIVEDMDVWRHYWSLLISYANDQVTRWGWQSLPSIDVIIYTGTIVENVADSYAYTLKVRGAPPKFVINQPLVRRGSSPADVHLVVHEVTPGHAFHLTFMEGIERRAGEAPVSVIEAIEKEFVFLPIALAAPFYEGWATFAQWLFGLRSGTARYNYQWILEIQFYVDRVNYLIGEKQPDSIHFARLADPLQLSAYFFGYLMWRRFYREARDDDELLRHALYGRFPPIDPQGGLWDLNSELSQILDEIENIEKRGKISLE